VLPENVTCPGTGVKGADVAFCAIYPEEVIAMRRPVRPFAVTMVTGVAATLALGAAACSDKSDATMPPLTATPSAPHASAPSTRAAAKEPITIAFAGDTHFHAQLAARLANPRTALGPIIPALKSADLTMVNLETAITTRGTKEPKEFNFRAPASAFSALKAAGIDVVSMANNHGVDYGQVGLADSLAAIKRSKYPVVGIGKNAAEAYRPYYTTVKDTRLAIIGATQVLDDNLIAGWTATDGHAGLASAKNAPRLIQEVRKARKNADAVIVYLHWGQEMRPCPLPRQKHLANQLVQAGADVIVGGHAHVPLGGGFFHGRYIDYGMGNFFFYAASGKTAESGILQLTLRGRQVTKAEWKPASISGGVPRLLTGAARQQALTRWNGLRACTGLTARR
jgi:poly-gamma-glutamate capsule biosynthesis protein CapA/YwtB (metallophosphatase superfamily)